MFLTKEGQESKLVLLGFTIEQYVGKGLWLVRNSKKEYILVNSTGIDPLIVDNGKQSKTVQIINLDADGVLLSSSDGEYIIIYKDFADSRMYSVIKRDGTIVVPCSNDFDILWEDEASRLISMYHPPCRAGLYEEADTMCYLRISRRLENLQIEPLSSRQARELFPQAF